MTTSSSPEALHALLIKIYSGQTEVSGGEIEVFERLCSRGWVFYNEPASPEGYKGVCFTGEGALVAQGHS